MDNEVNQLSLEVKETKKQCEVFLYLDETALDTLIQDLQKLKVESDHIHYMSNDWGGTSLRTTLFDERNIPIHHFKITRI